MKRLLPLMMLMAISTVASANTISSSWTNLFGDKPEIMEVIETLPQMSAQEFLALSPEAYEELSGQELSFWETRKLKAAQRTVKKGLRKNNVTEIDKTIYIVLTIFSLSWLAMGLIDDWEGNNWLIALGITAGGFVLAFFTFGLTAFAGIIWGFIKMSDYF